MKIENAIPIICYRHVARSHMYYPSQCSTAAAVGSNDGRSDTQEIGSDSEMRFSMEFFIWALKEGSENMAQSSVNWPESSNWLGLEQDLWVILNS